MAIHFVGFKGNEYSRAVRVWGFPDFFHRQNDVRLAHGGEVDSGDTVIFANGAENKFSKWAFNDSAIDEIN